VKASKSTNNDDLYFNKVIFQIRIEMIAIIFFKEASYYLPRHNFWLMERNFLFDV